MCTCMSSTLHVHVHVCASSLTTHIYVHALKLIDEGLLHHMCNGHLRHNSLHASFAIFLHVCMHMYMYTHVHVHAQCMHMYMYTHVHVHAQYQTLLDVENNMDKCTCFCKSWLSFLSWLSSAFLFALIGPTSTGSSAPSPLCSRRASFCSLSWFNWLSSRLTC